MIVVLSPARNLRQRGIPAVAPQTPLFAQEAMQLVRMLRTFEPYELESILDLNAKRTLDMIAAYSEFDIANAGRPALAAYYGAAYRKINVEDFTAQDYCFAQATVRIFSALYGLVRPFDGLLNHRLGMDFRPDGQSLYHFWGDKIANALDLGDRKLINLASKDYARLVLPFLPKEQVITCRFLVTRAGKVTTTVATVRAARGLMARYLIKNRIAEPKGLLGFEEDGYRFIPSLSDECTYSFLRV